MKMGQASIGLIRTLKLKRSLRNLDALTGVVPDLDTQDLRGLRKQARGITERANALIRRAEKQLTLEAARDALIPAPIGSDVRHRTDIWSGPIQPAGVAPARRETAVSPEVRLFHDCRNKAVSLRQFENTREEDIAAYGLQIDGLDFKGSFLSLVIAAPKALVVGLTRDHILRIETIVECERDQHISVRMNVKNGPNTEQVDRPLRLEGTTLAAEFDLSYTPMKENRTDEVWFDVFLGDMEMNSIRIRDLYMSRRLRSEI